MENVTITDFLQRAYKSDARKLLIPMELSAGWPSISIKKQQLCITLPYFKVQPGKGGQIFLFPLSYVMTLTWPNGVMIDFAELKYKKEYNKSIDFTKPVGIFKHEAVKNWTREEYAAKRKELYSYYDELIAGISEKKDFMHADEMRSLFRMLMEPSLYPMYRNIAGNFFESYCGL